MVNPGKSIELLIKILYKLKTITPKIAEKRRRVNVTVDYKNKLKIGVSKTWTWTFGL